METLLLPQSLKFLPGEHGYKGSFVIEPCYYGYGVTLGNALRRVLLSSLPGGAVTTIRVEGAQHEFSTIPNVKEDLVELILNFKLLRLKVFSEEPVMLVLQARGEKEVTAKDIKPNASVEIVNPDLHIATLTDAKAQLNIEIVVQQGRGYVTTEMREKEKLDIGMIAIDAAFTPVRNVGFQVENTRVGQITNYDKLTLTIETDGTVTPKEAFQQAVDILLNHFNFLKNYGQMESLSPTDVASPKEEPQSKDVQEDKEESVTKKGKKEG